MKKAFISSTLQTEWNRKYNKLLCDSLEERGVNCFLPQRDVDASSSVSIANDCFEAINKCSVLLSIVINESPNLGFEAGYAYGIKKPMILICKSDHNMPEMFYGFKTNYEFIKVREFEPVEVYIDELVEKVRRVDFYND